MNEKFIKKIVTAVQNTICKHTTPDFNINGEPVNFFESILGYDDVKAVIEKQFDNMGSVSDGYHTFDELYHHRAVLFSALCTIYADRSWKSKKHSDSSMYEGMFIVGIETPNGQATYHYNVTPYWDMFNVPILETAPEWDGHTAQDVIERILSLNNAKDNVAIIKRMSNEELAKFIINSEELRTDICCSNIECDSQDKTTNNCGGDCTSAVGRWLKMQEWKD